jgi:sugar lactone lactonase YvrE
MKLKFAMMIALVNSSIAIAQTTAPERITIKDIAQNPEGIEYDPADQTFLLSSLNAAPIIKVNADGSYTPFTHGEVFPLSTAGLQIDAPRNRLLVAGFNGTELMDNKPETKGIAHLRIYNLKSGVLEKDINLSSLATESGAYFANDIAVDTAGNVYISDWYAKLVYKVDTNGKPSVFWRNQTDIPSGPNGLDFHPEGYLLVSILSVNDKGLYADYGLVKIPTDKPDSASLVKINHSGYTGFDGMVLNAGGNVVGVTNNGKDAGGNTLMMLSSKDDWQTANVVGSTVITKSTTLAITPEQQHYVINQDFTNNSATAWTIEKVTF